MYELYRVTIRFIIFSLVIAFSPCMHADSLETLLMPGPVVKAHKAYEEKCNQCHDTSSKNSQSQLCISCHDHKNIKEDINDGVGFHGRLQEKVKTNCKHCHAEHKGREANIILINPSTFDHLQTDFPLKGKHLKTSCNACHKPEEKYSDAPGDCYSCHKGSDVHKGKQGKECGSCHKVTSWNETGFNHDKTDFPLKGAHKETICSACHINKKYKDTPVACISCHQIHDVHRGSFGKKCDSCHSAETWDRIRFDHNKETDFPLFGKHKKTSCNSCHVSVDVKKKLPKKCFGCHKNDDSHKGRYGEKCKDCHTTASWQKQEFDHDKKTNFPLNGKHKKTHCNQCHKGNLYKDKVKSACYFCHEKDDVHMGKQGKSCSSCHNENGWRSNVRFDHDLSPFPLIGMHATTPCEECHLSVEYGVTESGCNDCHEGDDIHETKLGTDCESCHNPNAWNTWLFDHSKATNFKIDGKHKDLGCYDCHKTKSNGKLEITSDCIFCHRSRDVHNRQFGRRCGNCHSTESFKDAVISR